MEDLIAAGRDKFAASQLLPLLHKDLRRVVEFQLTDNDAGTRNAALIVWLLNNGRELIDELDAARHRLAVVASWIDALPQWYAARDATAHLPIAAAYNDGHVQAMHALATSLGWATPDETPDTTPEETDRA